MPISPRSLCLWLCLSLPLTVAMIAGAAAEPSHWRAEWPETDFSRHSVPFDEILSGGPPKDGIPAIDAPRFEPASAIADIGGSEPVIRLEIGGRVRAYPLRVLMWHEIVNDRLGGVPVAVTYCPLCNAAIVFDRRLQQAGAAGQVLDFGTTGKLRHSDLVMYDRQTESWWQQFHGEAIVGALTGARLTMLPSRVEPFAAFRAAHPEGEVLVPADPGSRRYGANPYEGYDSLAWPFLFRGDYQDPIPPLAYVVAVGDRAWSLDLLKERGRIEAGDGLVLEWRPGMSSALDAGRIGEGRDIGQVIATEKGRQAVHDVTFAFAFRAFWPDGRLHVE